MSRPPCPVCQAPMVGEELWRIYCSTACTRLRDTVPRPGAGEPVVDRDMKPGKFLAPGPRPRSALTAAPAQRGPCPECGGHLPASTGPRARITCSPRCAQRRNNKAAAARARERSKRAAPVDGAPCPCCGSPVPQRAAGKGRPSIYCSPACRKLAHAERLQRRAEQGARTVGGRGDPAAPKKATNTNGMFTTKEGDPW